MAVTDAAVPANRANRASLPPWEKLNLSLTDGTDIPSPPQTPTKDIVRPPTPGGGPLSSHPTTPDDRHRSPAPNGINGTNGDFVQPGSPASAYMTSPTARPRRPSGVRRLFSLNNLRASFSSSRTSLSLPQSDASRPATGVNGAKRPTSPSISSSLASSSQASQPPSSRPKRSGNWFKRKSMLFLPGGDGLDSVAERPETRDGKKLKAEPAPLLPEVSALGGGDAVNDGAIGWDDHLFKRI